MLKNKIDELNRTHQNLKTLKIRLKKDIKETEEKIQNLKKEEQTLNLTSQLFQNLIDREISNPIEVLRSIQEEALGTIYYDQDIGVEVESKLERGKVSINLITVQKKDGETIKGDSTKSFGGSILTIQSLLMRIIVILKRDLLNLILLDESLSALDDGYANNVGTFLHKVCEELKFDILVVTHSDSLFECGNKKYIIKSSSNGSYFQEV